MEKEVLNFEKYYNSLNITRKGSYVMLWFHKQNVVACCIDWSMISVSYAKYSKSMNKNT